MRVKDGLSELVLKPENLDEMERIAKAESLRDYFLIALMGRRGLRVGSVTGNHGYCTYTRKRTGETVTVTSKLPGIVKEDIVPEGVQVHEKGHIQRIVWVPKSLHAELREYAKTMKPRERLVPITAQQASNLTRKYARLAGIQNWERMHPHRLRHFFGTHYARKTGRDPWKLKSLMGHKDLRMTMVYVEDLSLEEEREIIEGIE